VAIRVDDVNYGVSPETASSLNRTPTWG
jgi:hypothetical protein